VVISGAPDWYAVPTSLMALAKNPVISLEREKMDSIEITTNETHRKSPVTYILPNG